jgi:formamidopyrimidine-DNA glycosylase
LPEFPDLTLYLEALHTAAANSPLRAASLSSPFLLRTVSPSLDSFLGASLAESRLLGKRLALGFSNGQWMVIHLMIAGRLHWNTPTPPRSRLAQWRFDSGVLTLTEAGSRRQASLHLLPDTEALASLDPGGLDIFHASPEDFTARLQSANHTLKRALTDPRILSGIGNAYSDEILHHAQLSPVLLTSKLTAPQAARLLASCRDRLTHFLALLRRQAAGAFPAKVTAFLPEMAAHGKFGQPCPRCRTPIQRIRYASNECNYCPACQTGGKLLADRALSRLLGKDWPRSLEELENRHAAARRTTPA